MLNHAPPAPFRRYAEAAILVAIIFFFSIQEAMMAPASPAILKAFAASPAQAGWLSGASLFGVSLVVPLLGRLADLYDKGWIILGTALFALLGSVVGLLAPSFPVLLGGQVLIGLSYALHPLGVGLMAQLLPPERRPTGIGCIIGASVAGTTIGLVGSGPLVAAHGIRAIYGAPMVVLAVLFLALAWLQLREGRPWRSNNRAAVIDWWGALFLCATTILLMLGLATGAQAGWTAVKTLTYLACALATCAAFVAVERRHRSPMLDLALFKIPGVSVVSVMAVACGVGTIIPAMLIPLIIQADTRSGIGLGLSVTATGLFMLPFGIAACAAAPLSGTLRRRIDNRACLLLSAVLIFIGNAFLFAWHDSVAMIALSMALTGAGIGLASAETMNTVVEIVGRERIGSASSMVYVLKGMGAMAVSQICAGFLGAATNRATGLTGAAGYTAGFTLCVSVCAVAVVACLWFRARPAGAVAGPA